MPIDRSTLLFFDASTLVAAAGSSRGGSAFLLWLCRRGFLRGAVSQPVLFEADRNVRENLPPSSLQRLFWLLRNTPLLMAFLPRGWGRPELEAAVGAKDHHVLAAAVSVGAPSLITLDKRFREGVNAGAFATRAYTPGEFIGRVLPLHEERPNLG
jgi:hypothetical protein